MTYKFPDKATIKVLAISLAFGITVLSLNDGQYFPKSLTVDTPRSVT